MDNGKSSIPNRDVASENKNKDKWTLEESSLWWLSLDIWKNPGNILLISSVPLCIGAYFGYQQPTKRFEKLVGADKGGGVEQDVKMLQEGRQLGIRTASRALRIATLSTMGTFGVLGAGFFYAFGFESVDQFLHSTRTWAYAQREAFENWIGFEDRPSETHPEVVATKHMTEDEEMNYIWEKYIKEPEDSTEQDGNVQDANNNTDS